MRPWRAADWGGSAVRSASGVAANICPGVNAEISTSTRLPMFSRFKSMVALRVEEQEGIAMSSSTEG